MSFWSKKMVISLIISSLCWMAAKASRCATLRWKSFRNPKRLSRSRSRPLRLEVPPAPPHPHLAAPPPPHPAAPPPPHPAAPPLQLPVSRVGRLRAGRAPASEASAGASPPPALRRPLSSASCVVVSLQPKPYLFATPHQPMF